jgi:hypothetical protein
VPGPPAAALFVIFVVIGMFFFDHDYDNDNRSLRSLTTTIRNLIILHSPATDTRYLIPEHHTVPDETEYEYDFFRRSRISASFCALRG